MSNRRLVSLLAATLLALGLAACHDDDDNDPPPAAEPPAPIATFSIGGTVVGAAGALTLQNSNGTTLAVAANGAFTFATQMVSAAAYNVTVAVPPSSQSCTVANGSGTVALANVTNITVTCTNNPLTVGGTVSGLGAGKTVVLNLLADFVNGSLTVSANGAFTMGVALTSNTEFSLLVQTQPVDQTCTVANGEQIIANAGITNVAVTCANNSASARNWGSSAFLTVDDDVQDNDSFRTPKVAFDAAGNALAIWEQDRDGALGSELYFSRYTAGGSWNAPVMIPNQFTPIPGQPSTATRRKPQLAVAANGNAVAVWVESVHSVSASLYTPGSGPGSGWSTPEHLYDNLVTGLGGTIDPKVAIDASGNVLVVWENNMVGAGRHIQYNRYSPGTGWTAPANLGRLVNELQFAAREPEIAMLPNGNAIAIWIQAGGGGFDESRLWSSRYDVTADTWSTPQAVDTHDTSNLLYGEGVGGRKSVVTDAAGNASAVWTQSDGTRAHIVFNRLTGNTWGTPAIVETYTTVYESSNAHDVRASIDGSGNIMAMWLQINHSEDAHYVANRYVPGTGWGSQVNIGNYAPVGYDTAFEIVSNAAGQTVAVWSLVSGIGDENVPDPVFVSANEYNPANNTWGVQEVIDRIPFFPGANDGDSASPALAVDASGNAFAVWMQSNSSEEGIQVNRFD